MSNGNSTGDDSGLSGAVRDLIDVCRMARMATEGPAASLSERVSGGKPGSAHLQMTDELPVELELERTLRRVADVYRRRIEGRQVGLPAQDKVSAARKAQTKAVLAEVGMDATALAFVYGLTTEAVKKLRGRNGRDPETGQRIAALRAERIDGTASKRAPLTAPATVAQGRLEERHAYGELVG